MPTTENASDFIVARFKLYAGPKFTSTISNLSVGYYIDWDIPSDTGSENNSVVDASRSAVIQRGAYTAPNVNKWGALAAARGDGNPIIGGFVVDNPTYIYPSVGWHTDSLWKYTQLLLPGEYKASPVTNEDLSSLVLMFRGATLGANDTLEACVILAGEDDATTVSGVQGALDAAYTFMSQNEICGTPCMCGDADSNGSITISDAVYLINYIFAGGPAPNPICLGDADNNGSVTISDAVYLVNYIFAGGPAPGPNC